MKHAALYVRVSHEEQVKHGLSVDAQIEALKKYCELNNYNIVDIYSDAGISARKKYTKRPALLNMIKDCQDGKIDLILITKLDRFFRSVPDYYEVMSQIGNVPWRTIWEDYNTETSDGVLKVNIMLSVAQAEADKTSERIRSVFEYKRAKGDYVGSACIGYKRENNKLVKDEATAPIVEEIFKYYLTTYSVKKVQVHLKELGYKLHVDTIRQILTKETYCGNANGFQTYAYISWADHNAIVNAIKSRTCKQTKIRHEYTFSGLLVCGYCGAYLSGKTNRNQHKDGTIVECPYYSCEGRSAAATHKKYQTISEAKMEKYLLDNIDPLIQSFNNSKFESPQTKPVDNSRKIIQLQSKLDRIGIRFEDGDISVDEYRTKRTEIQKEIKELQMVDNTGEIVPIVIPSNWQNIYESLDNIHKRAFWRSFIDYIVITNETKDKPKIIFK